jgi:hypothetical protein
LATVYDERNLNCRPSRDDSSMTKPPAIFPNLKKISLEMIRFDSNHLEQFLKATDGRLTGLHLLAGRDGARYSLCLNATLETIGRYCPNLTSFRYGFHRRLQENHFDETVTSKGIIALLRACPKVKV